jgi:hypothetical protein
VPQEDFEHVADAPDLPAVAADLVEDRLLDIRMGRLA